jgi:hypothetical protein
LHARRKDDRHSALLAGRTPTDRHAAGTGKHFPIAQQSVPTSYFEGKYFLAPNETLGRWLLDEHGTHVARESKEIP